MRAVGIICEYNPFHAGHAHQLSTARRDTDADVVLAVMSEYITQRGELAVADGYTRAISAVRCGADLVIGLPYPYSGAPAEYFAAAGVSILDALGVSFLHFGSECGNIEALQAAARVLSSPDFIERLTARQSSHPAEGVMQSRAMVYEQLIGAPLPSGSNDLLAISYLQALAAQNSALQPFTIPRAGQAYTDNTPPTPDAFPSASALRRLWREQGLSALATHLPPPVFQTLCDAVNDHRAPLSVIAIEMAILAYYRTVDRETLSGCAGMEGGLCDRLIAGARACTNLDAMLARATTRRYTDARIRRAMLAGLFGVKPTDLSAPPAYVRLLAANAKGCAYLASIRRSCTLPILTKPADLPDTPAARRQRAIEDRLESYVTLATPVPQEAGALLRARPYIEP